MCAQATCVISTAPSPGAVRAKIRFECIKNERKRLLRAGDSSFSSLLAAHHPSRHSLIDASFMAYFSDFVKSTLSKVVLGKEIPAFPYTIGDRVDSFDSSIWALHKGIKRVRRASLGCHARMPSFSKPGKEDPAMLIKSTVLPLSFLSPGGQLARIDPLLRLCPSAGQVASGQECIQKVPDHSTPRPNQVH